MALPPEPLDELLPLALFGVVAKVTAILQRDKAEPVPEHPDPAFINAPRDLPRQLVQLSVMSVLFGELPAGEKELRVYKPAGDYSLREGVEGSFLLAKDENDDLVILGRYGADSYSPQALAAAIKVHKGTN